MAAIYERELSIPLTDMEKTYVEFKVLCERNSDKFKEIDWPRIDEKYYRAKSILEKMLPFELKLAEIPSSHHQDRASAYLEYIAEGKKFLSEQLVQVLYERMVADCCLNRKFT